jgi:hypothetical protein
MTPKLRAATLEDLKQVRRLVWEFLKEHDPDGCPGRLSQLQDLGLAYLRGDVRGAVVLAEGGRGMVIGGAAREDPPATETCQVWVAWTHPDERKTGLALAMLHWGRHRMLELGFTKALMGIVEGNAGGQELARAYGAKPMERLYSFPLLEEPHGQRQ